MAKPIVTEMKDFGKDIMNRDEKDAGHYGHAKKPVFFAISTRLLHPQY